MIAPQLMGSAVRRQIRYYLVGRPPMGTPVRRMKFRQEESDMRSSIKGRAGWRAGHGVPLPVWGYRL